MCPETAERCHHPRISKCKSIRDSHRAEEARERDWMGVFLAIVTWISQECRGGGGHGGSTGVRVAVRNVVVKNLQGCEVEEK